VFTLLLFNFMANLWNIDLYRASSWLYFPVGKHFAAKLNGGVH